MKTPIEWKKAFNREIDAVLADAWTKVRLGASNIEEKTLAFSIRNLRSFAAVARNFRGRDKAEWRRHKQYVADQLLECVLQKDRSLTLIATALRDQTLPSPWQVNLYNAYVAAFADVNDLPT